VGTTSGMNRVIRVQETIRIAQQARGDVFLVRLESGDLRARAAATREASGRIRRELEERRSVGQPERLISAGSRVGATASTSSLRTRASKYT